MNLFKLHEKKAVFAIAFFAMLLTCVPYLYGWTYSTPQQYYIASRETDLVDTPTYYSWIEQARQGKFLFRELYTAEPQQPALFHPVFLILGIIGRLTHFSNQALFQGARVLSGLVFFILLYVLLGYFFERPKERLLAYLILVFGSGLGWFLGGYSLDLVAGESTNFLSAYQSILDTLGLSLLILAILAWFGKNKRGHLTTAIMVGVLMNLIVLVHSYEYILLIAILSVYVFFDYLQNRDFESLKVLVYSTVISLPSIFYQIYVMYHNSALGTWATLDTYIHRATIYDYFFVYFVFIVFAVVTLVIYRKEFSSKQLLPVSWVLAASILLFNPISHRYQQKFTIGIIIPLTILMVPGIFWWLSHWNKTAKYLFAGAIFVLLFSTNVTVIVKDMRNLKRNHSYETSRLYVSTYDMESFEWIKSHVPENSIVLAGDKTANLIPGFTGRNVYYGHFDQTIDFEQKKNLAQKVFDEMNNTASASTRFFSLNNIKYVLLNEETGTPTLSPNQFKLVYSNSTDFIYEIN